LFFSFVSDFVRRIKIKNVTIFITIYEKVAEIIELFKDDILKVKNMYPKLKIISEEIKRL